MVIGVSIRCEAMHVFINRMFHRAGFSPNYPRSLSPPLWCSKHVHHVRVPASQALWVKGIKCMYGYPHVIRPVTADGMHHNSPVRPYAMICGRGFGFGVGDLLSSFQIIELYVWYSSNDNQQMLA